MNRKYQATAICILTGILFVSGCGSPSTMAPATNGNSPATAVLSLTATDTLPATSAPTPTDLALETYIAYVQNDVLLVTHVMAGQSLDTQQIIESPVEGGIFNVGWSPSGEYLSFYMFVTAIEYHLFVVNAMEGSTPVDLGLANDWGWSPDSKLLAFEHEYELWVFSPANGQSRGLTTHLGVDWLWSTPVFTPSGDALVAAGTLTYTDFKLYRVPLDGSAADTYPFYDMPSMTAEITGRPPTTLRFSPDGQMLAIITSENVDICEPVAEAFKYFYSSVATHYYLANADGSDLHELSAASLAAINNPAQQLYFYGDSLVWSLDSTDLWVNGLVRDCGRFPNAIVGGPQISRVTLDGQELQVIPGAYAFLSLDHTGMLLGVVNRNEGVPHVQILGLDGHLVLDLGEGDQAVLQP